MSGLHVCHVVLRGYDRRGEWVEIANGRSTAVRLTGLKLTDYTATQQLVHIFTFPGTTSGAPLMLPPKKSAFVFTSGGRNQWSSSGNLLLFAGRAAQIWNDDGDVAYLRNPNGTFIDTMTVGHPKRHPKGH